MLTFKTEYRHTLPIPIREVWFAGSGDAIPQPTLAPQFLRVFHSDARIEGIPGHLRRTRTLLTRLDDLDALEPTFGSTLRRHIRQSIERDDSRVVTDWNPQQLVRFADTFDAANPNRPNLARMLGLAAVGGLGIAAALVGDVALCAHVYVEDTAIGLARLLYSFSARPRRSVSDKREDESPETARFAALVARANKALHWRDMQRYRDRGFRWYDWGGFSGQPDNGIDRFKLQFRGEPVERWCFDGVALPRWTHVRPRTA